MSELPELGGRAFGPAGVVERDVGLDVPLADAGDPAAVGPEGVQFGGQARREVRVGDAAAGQQHRPRPLGAQAPDVLDLQLRIAEGGGDHDHQPVPLGGPHRPGGDRPEVRVGDVVDDQAHHRGRGPGQRLRGRVGDVAEVPRRVLDLAAQLLPHGPGAPVEHPRGRGDRHPGVLRDALQRHGAGGTGGTGG